MSSAQDGNGDDVDKVDHVIEAARASQRLNTEDHEQATPLTRAIVAITNVSGQLSRSRRSSAPVLDPLPFEHFELILGFLSVVLALMILATQQHDNILAE